MLCFSGCKQNNDSELIKTEAVETQQTAFVEKEGEVLVRIFANSSITNRW